MNRKALPWAICVLLYVMQIPFAVVLIIVAVNPDFSDAVFRGIAIASASLCVLVVVLCVLNFAAALKDYFNGQKFCPYAVTMKVKLALVPFFIITCAVLYNKFCNLGALLAGHFQYIFNMGGARSVGNIALHYVCVYARRRRAEHFVFLSAF